MAEKFKFGIVGCGLIAPHHAESILAGSNSKLVAVCDIIEEKAREFAEKYNLEKYYTDYRQMIDEAGMDIVCVCTPSGNHGEIAVYAANAGKHLLVEKPIETTREKMDEIIRAVKKNNVKMNSVFQIRTEPAFIAVKKAIEEGRFGDIILADAYLKSYRSQEYYDSADWRGKWELDGGGALMNQGIHGVDILLWLAGDVESVFARVGTKARNIEVEDTAVAMLKFKNGAFGIIEGTTSVYPGQPKKFEIHGKKGSVVIGEKGIEVWQIEGNDEEKAPQLHKNGDDTANDPGKFALTSHLILVEDLTEAIENDRRPLIPPEEGRKAVDLILAIYESARTGKEIKLDWR